MKWQTGYQKSPPLVLADICGLDEWVDSAVDATSRPPRAWQSVRPLLLCWNNSTPDTSQLDQGGRGLEDFSEPLSGCPNVPRTDLGPNGAGTLLGRRGRGLGSTPTQAPAGEGKGWGGG